MKYGLLILAAFLASCMGFISTDGFQKRSARVELENLPTSYPQDFRTGIVVAIKRPGPFIRQPMMVVIKNEKNGETIRKQIEWDRRTGLSLVPSEYTIKTHVPYMDKEIWETKTEAVLDSGMIADLTFTFPGPNTNGNCTAKLTPYRANKASRSTTDN